jgi:arylsulfatase
MTGRYLDRQYAEHKPWWVLTPLLGVVQKHLESFRDFPVRSQLGLSANVAKT